VRECHKVAVALHPGLVDQEDQVGFILFEREFLLFEFA
jgi:hypothetical protein